MAISGASGFIGTHEHSLDAKGRLTLPARFRAVLGESCVIGRSEYSDDCLAIWRNHDFDEYSNRLIEQDMQDDAVRRRVRIWSSEAFPVEIDANGRLAVPARLRQYASLAREVLVIGAIKTIELWSPELWDAYRGGDDV